MLDGAVETPAGPVIRVRTRVTFRERLAALAATLEPERAEFHVVPALYAVGSPGPTSPVLICSNHKGEFDALRAGLRRTSNGHDVWILALDTRGLRVWTAARLGKFNRSELTAASKAASLMRVAPSGVRILPPQLASTLSLQEAREWLEFKTIWGPRRLSDAGAFLDAGLRYDASLRRPDFPLRERLGLIPAAVWRLRRLIFWALLACLLCSAVGPWGISLRRAAADGQLMALAMGAGALGGAVLVPILLPWLPGQSLAIRGALAGLLSALPLALSLGQSRGPLAAAALTLTTLAVASRLASDLGRNSESPELTEPEEKYQRFIPWQWALGALALALWLARGLTPDWI